jgi:DNA-binding SARP family transcriptional activator
LELLPAEYRDCAAYIKTFSNVLNVSGDNAGVIAFLKDKLSPERFTNDIESFGSLWANYWWARTNTEPGLHYDAAVEAHRELTASTTGFSPTMMGIFQNTLGMAAHLELRLSEAVQHVRNAADLIEEPYARLRVVARQNEALYSHLLGNSVTALGILKQARDDCDRLHLQSQYPKILMLKASIHLAMGRYHETLSDVDQCVASMREIGGYSLQLSAYIGRFRGLALWYTGDKSEGLRLLKAAQGPAKEFGALTGMEVALLCEYYSLLDDCPVRLVDEKDIPNQYQPSECRLVSLTLQAMRAFKRADRVNLKRNATQILDLARSCEMQPWIATGSFLLAMSLNHSRDKQRLIELLEQGLRIVSQIGWLSYPMMNNNVTAFVIAKATRLGIDTALVDPLLATGTDIDLTPDFDTELNDTKLTAEERIRLWESASHLNVRGLSRQLRKHSANATSTELPALNRYREFLSQRSLPPLRVEMLGGFSVSAKSRVVRFNRSSSRLLLQHLLVTYPREIHEEELIEQLWPETDPVKGRASLRTTVKDLRKALDPYTVPRGPSYVTYANQHYGLELPVESHIDYISFTNLMRECLEKEASHLTPIDDRITAFRMTVEAYRGPLLPMLPYEAFTVELREQLQARYLRGSLKLAELLITNNSLEEAATVVERALGYDQLWTDGVRVFLKIHAMRGEILKAMRIYRSYEKRLKEELDLPPDESIRRLLDEILQSSVS